MELAQVVTNALFSLPATKGYDGPVVCLQRPTDRLPGEKHISRRRRASLRHRQEEAVVFVSNIFY